MVQARVKRPRRTPEQATHFDRFSVQNATMAEAILQDSGGCKGTCHAYADIFTYDRWQVLGFQVKKGEHGAKLPVIVSSVKESEDGTTVTLRRPWTTTVFCRCQVAPKEKALSSQAGEHSY